MNDRAKKSTAIQSFAAGFFGFVGILGAGTVLMTMATMHRGAVKSPMALDRPLEAPEGAAPPSGIVQPAPASAAVLAAAVPAAVPVAAGSPRPVSPPAEAVRGAASSPAPVAPPADAAPFSAAPSASAEPRLEASASVDMSGSASSSAAPRPAAAAAAKNAPAPAIKPAAASRLVLPKNAGAVATTVHYGVSGRSELMGRAAGPVYNFSGGGSSQGEQIAADDSTPEGALQEADAALKQFDASSASDEDKAKVHQQLEQAKAGAAAAP